MNIFKSPHILYNVDVVGAKSGKKLSRLQKAINYIVNLVLVVLTIIASIIFLIGLCVLMYDMVNIMFDYIGENPWALIYVLAFVIAKIISDKKGNTSGN